MDYSPSFSVAPITFLNSGPLRRSCIDCTNIAVPACPVCPSGQACAQTVQTCTSCVSVSCIANSAVTSGSSSNTSSGSSSGPNIGAIVGGVVGGIIVTAVLIYLAWKFFVKNKRGQYENDAMYMQDGMTYPDAGVGNTSTAEKDFAFMRGQRASTHTMGSMASSVLTRASNIIQIAYIPGLGTRSHNASQPNLLVPPVPPIPLGIHAPEHSPAYTEEHFFMPGDIRDSSYSRNSGYTNRNSAFTDRTSYAPRSSVASTIYGKNAIVSPVTPQIIVRGGKAAVVSVKSGNGSPGTITPPVPSVDFERFHDSTGAVAAGPPSPAFSVGATFLSAADAARYGGTTRSVRSGLSTVSDADESEGEEDAIVIIDDTTSAVGQGPFSDAQRLDTSDSERSASKAKEIEAATMQAMMDVQKGLGRRANARDESPFSDRHEARGE